MYCRKFYIIILLFLLGVNSSFANITIEGPNVLYINTEYTFTSFFSDTSNNEADTEYWNWRVEVINGDGVTSLIGIDSLQGINESSWVMSIDTIPVFHSNQIHINHEYYELYSGLLIVYTTDSEGITHTLGKHISLIGDKRDPYTPPSDAFMFIDTHAKEIYKQSDIEFKGVFVDDYGTGVYAEYWNWQLFLFNTDSILLLRKADSLFTSNNISNLSVHVDSLPSNYTFIKDSSGSIITFLTTNTTDSYDRYFSQVDELSFVDNPTSIHDYNFSSKPKNLKLFQNYPNPFNPNTTISFSLDKPSFVLLEIYNSLGQHVRELVQKKYTSGYHEIIWDGKDSFGTDMSSGVYLYQLKTNYFTQTRKMLLLR